ncbi:hypothetical protein KIN20_019076, partial [Parelaphostrongylus tenuis]
SLQVSLFSSHGSKHSSDTTRARATNQSGATAKENSSIASGTATIQRTCSIDPTETLHEQKEQSAGTPKGAAPIDLARRSSNITAKGSNKRSPCPRRHNFTKADAVRALERERLAQERLRIERQAKKKKCEEAIRLRRQAVEEANKFNKVKSVGRLLLYLHKSITPFSQSTSNFWRRDPFHFS